METTTVKTPTTTSSSLGSASSSSSLSSSSSSSTASSAKAFMADAYNSIKAGVAKASDATSRTVKRMGDRPNTMICSNHRCAKTLPLPASIWTWKCSQGHENIHTVDNCTSCQETKLNALGHTVSWPAIRCPDCNTVTTVPANSFETGVYDSGTIIRNSFYSVTKGPDTFHCWNCNTELNVPTGSWVCHNCTVENEPLTGKCKTCSQNRREQKVVCGHCHQPTGISKSGILDSVASAMRSLKHNSTKIFYDATGQKNLLCPTCTAPIKIPSTIAPISIDDKGTNITAPANSSWSFSLQCEQCHNAVNLSKQNIIPMPAQHETAVPVSAVSSQEKGETFSAVQSHERPESGSSISSSAAPSTVMETSTLSDESIPSSNLQPKII